jgi:hypothetical protein
MGTGPVSSQVCGGFDWNCRSSRLRPEAVTFLIYLIVLVAGKL